MTENNPAPSKVQSLYVALRNKGLSEEQLGSFEDFHQGMSDEKARARLYDELSKLNIKAGKSFDDFNSRLTQFYEDDRQAEKSTAKSYVEQMQKEVDEQQKILLDEKKKGFRNIHQGGDPYSQFRTPATKPQEQEQPGVNKVENQDAIKSFAENITAFNDNRGNGRSIPVAQTQHGVQDAPINPSKINPALIANRYDEDLAKLQAADTELERAGKTLNDTEKKDVHGVGDALSVLGKRIGNAEAEDFVPFIAGTYEAEHNSQIAAVSAKIEKGEPLSLADSMLAKSAGLNAQAQSVSDVSNWAVAGESIVHMVPFIGEMVATAGIGSGVSGAVQVGMKAKALLQGVGVGSRIARGTIFSNFLLFLYRIPHLIHSTVLVSC